jgi:choline dehydrogenase
MTPVYDYVIAGAGSAGCALANRLSADASRKVLLLEAGPTDWHPFIRMPVGEALTVGGSIDWKFKTEAEPGFMGRSIDAPRGKVLGGSSAINGMIYVRGHAGDFDDWAALGCGGWSYRDVLTSFRRSESWNGAPSQERGSAGPLQTVFGRHRTPLYQAFLNAGRSLGFKLNPDYNGGDHEGFSWTQYTQTHKRARRCSSAHAYLGAIKCRKNLTIETGAHVLGLVLEGTRCSGIRYIQDGRQKSVAAKEVILSAGAYASPQILLLSGIGDPEELSKAGVTPVFDLPGVGRNLQDHCGSLIQSRCTKPVTYHSLRNPFRGAAAILELVFKSSGPFSVFPMAAQAFVRSSSEETRPDLQIQFSPVTTDVQGGTGKLATFNGYAITWGHMRPKSRGRVTLQSNNPLVQPRIQHNFLTDPHDIKVINRGFELARKLNAQHSMDEYRGEEVDPGQAVQSEADITAYNRRVACSQYHPSGTCKMGIDDQAVVDPKLRVHGIKGLRVADASIMPNVTSGNTNAPSIMIGERAAEIILTGA